MALSKLELLFLAAWSKYGSGRIPAREYVFSPTRRYRLDFAWVKERVGVELDGFSKFGFGAHQTIVGVTRDHEKGNHAAELGWVLLRYTSKQLGSEAKREQVIQQIIRIVRQRTCDL
jgi:very-short-patch-repair endonuclease